MSSSVRLSVCRLSSVTFVHRTQAIEIFGNISTPFNTLAIWRHPGKILRRSSQGNPSAGRVKNTTGVAKYSDFGPFRPISRKRCKIGGKLLLITHRKLHELMQHQYYNLWQHCNFYTRSVQKTSTLWLTLRVQPRSRLINLLSGQAIVLRVRGRRKGSSRSLSHLLMSFLLYRMLQNVQINILGRVR